MVGGLTNSVSFFETMYEINIKQTVRGGGVGGGFTKSVSLLEIMHEMNKNETVSQAINFAEHMLIFKFLFLSVNKCHFEVVWR